MDSRDWDERYADSELVWTATPNRFLVAEVTGLAPGRALDVACGEGRNAVWLAEQGWAVTGIDFAANGLAKGAELARHRGVDVAWVHADVTAWTPPPGAFDLVVILYLHLPVDDRSVVLARAASALARSGTLLVVAHADTNIADGFGGPQDPSVLYGPDDVAATVPDLVIEKAERVLRPVDTDAGPVDAIDVLVRGHRPG